MSLNARAIALQGIGYPAGALAAQGLAVFDAQVGEPVGFAGGFPAIWSELIRDGLPDYERQARIALAIVGGARVAWEIVDPAIPAPELQIPEQAKPVARTRRRAQAAPALPAVQEQARVLDLARLASISLALAGGVRADYWPDYVARAAVPLDITGSAAFELVDRFPEVRARQARVIAALIAAGEL